MDLVVHSGSTHAAHIASPRSQAETQSSQAMVLSSQALVPAAPHPGAAARPRDPGPAPGSSTPTLRSASPLLLLPPSGTPPRSPPPSGTPPRSPALLLPPSVHSGSPGAQALVRRQSGGASPGDESSRLHIQLLAAEVARLRNELATLQAQRSSAGPTGADQSVALVQARMQKERKVAEKAEVVAQADAQKKMLADEVKKLRSEVQTKQLESANTSTVPGPVSEALEKRKAFQEQFSVTLRQLREELVETSVKRLSGRSRTPQGIRALLVLSDERIVRIMNEAHQVPVEDRLHIEAVRLFIMNCKQRLALNEYARGMLHSALVKDGPPVPADNAKVFGMI